MANVKSGFQGNGNRRSFLKLGTLGVGGVGATVLSERLGGFAEDPLNRGDIAILTFLSAVEQVEADLWIQYAELGGATSQGLSPIDVTANGKKIQTGLAPNYVLAL